MMRRPRRNHTPAFKAKVALAALKGEKTLTEIAQAFDVHPNLVTQWKNTLLEGATGVFGSGNPGADPQTPVDIKSLHAKIGQLTLENDPPPGFRGPTGATVPAPMSGALTKAGMLSAKR